MAPNLATRTPATRVNFFLSATCRERRKDWKRSLNRYSFVKFNPLAKFSSDERKKRYKTATDLLFLGSRFRLDRFWAEIYGTRSGRRRCLRAIGFCRDIGLRDPFSKNAANPRKIKLNLIPSRYILKLNLRRSGRAASDTYAIYFAASCAALHDRDDKNADYEVQAARSLGALRLKKG